LICYFAVRKGRVTVKPRDVPSNVGEDAWARYLHELREGIHYLRHRRHVVLLGISWAIFIAGMLTQGVTTAPLSDRILHAGAQGYGWLNAGWAIGAFTSTLYAPLFIRWLPGRRSVLCAMTMLALSLTAAPFTGSLAFAVLCYVAMGSGRPGSVGGGGVEVVAGNPVCERRNRLITVGSEAIPPGRKATTSINSAPWK